MAKHLKTAGAKVSIQFRGKRPVLKVALTDSMAKQLFAHLCNYFKK